MKILVTGVNGQLGHDVVKESLKRGYAVIGCGSSPEYKGVSDIKLPLKEIGQLNMTVENDNGEEYKRFCAGYLSLDITDREVTQRIIKEIKPDGIVHCAAWTNVDGAEEPDNQPKVYRINVEGTQNIADAAKTVGAKMIYISTDYVFNGQGVRPWDPDDKCYAPLNIYGQSKLGGELAVANTLEKYFVVRVAWVFGLNGKNFIKTMINVGKTHDKVRVVNDQIGTPTYTKDLAKLLVDMIETEKYGYYHATNEGGYLSWYDFCCEIYKQYGLNTKVIPVSTEEYGLSVAARPYNSRLEKKKLVESGFQPLPDWKDAISRYLKEANL